MVATARPPASVRGGHPARERAESSTVPRTSSPRAVAASWLWPVPRPARCWSAGGARGLRGRGLLPLLRPPRAGAGVRGRRGLRPARRDRGDPAVELPAGHPHGHRRSHPRRRLAVIRQPSPVPPLLHRGVRGAVGGRCAARRAAARGRRVEGEAGKTLISTRTSERVVLAGTYETAQLFASWDPERRSPPETSGQERPGDHPQCGP
ncbi:hypothetical protein QJS66_15620 [Kocuria rhizophila]|nr:hypothetical protein QJS66_15620 [Kocuria rhizophila]